MEKATIYKCTENPHPDFIQAFSRMVAHVREILEIPETVWPGVMTVSGVSFSQSDEGVEGAVITGFVALTTANAPFNFNTPHLPFDQYSETGESPLMPDWAQKDLELLREEAEAYMNGTKRAQQELAGIGS